MAERYKTLLDELGVQISVSKSFEERGLAEFAKSYFSYGRDFTPLPAACLALRRNTTPVLMVDVVKILARKGLDYADPSAILFPSVPEQWCQSLYTLY